MQWQYQQTAITELPENCVGFVYEITCLENQRKYIGKKLAKFKTTRYKMHTQKNGKKQNDMTMQKEREKYQQIMQKATAQLI